MSLPAPASSTQSPTETATGSSCRSTTFVDPEFLQRTEAPLMALASSCQGDLRKLLFAFFSFLHHWTDFYMIPHADDAGTMQHRAGFREGDAEKLLLASFRQFPLRRIPRSATQATATVTTTTSATTPKPTTTTPQTTKKASSSTQLESTTASKTTSSPTSSDATSREVSITEDVGSATTTENSSSSFSPQPPSEKSENKTSCSEQGDHYSNTIRYTDKGVQVPVGNGGATSLYQWTQTLDECTVLIALPVECKRAKDLTVKLTSTSLDIQPKIESLSLSSSFSVSGNLSARIVVSESTWTIEGGVLILLLHKEVKTFWKSILIGDEEIDTTLVDSRRHIAEYDTATQAQLRKLMFDEQQRRKGLPTSDELLGVKPILPPLHSGVEYINPTILSEKADGKEKAAKK